MAEFDQKLLLVARRVLSIRYLAATDDLFDAGMTSMAALALADAFSEVLGRDVTVADVYLGGSVEGVGRTAVGTAGADVAAVQRGVRSGAALPVAWAADRRSGDAASFTELVGMQASFALAHGFDPDDLGPLCLASWRIVGPVDIEALNAAVRDVGQRHQALRASYAALPTPSARVSDGAPSAVLQILPSTPMEETATLRLRDHLANRLNIEEGEVWRCAVIPFDSGTLFGFCVHHVAFDAWSQNIVLRELTQAYAARQAGGFPEFDRSPATLDQISRERVRQLTSDRQSEQLAFWRGALADLPSLDFGPSAPSSSRVVCRPLEGFELPAGDADTLRESATEAQTTMLVLLLSLFAVALHKVTGQDQFGVGVPVSKRDIPSAENAVGCLINTLCVPFRNVSNDITEMLIRTEEIVMRSFAAQDVPFPTVVRELRPPRSERNPLYQTMFALQDVEHRSLKLPGCVVVSIDLQPPRSLHELLVEVRVKPDGGLEVVFDFQPERIGADIVWAVRMAYEEVLTRISRATGTT